MPVKSLKQQRHDLMARRVILEWGRCLTYVYVTLGMLLFCILIPYLELPGFTKWRMVGLLLAAIFTGGWSLFMGIFYYKTQYTPAKRALSVSLMKPSKMKCRFRIEKEIEFFTSDPKEKKERPEPDKHILELSRQGMQYKIEYFPARDRDWRRAKKFDGQSIDVHAGQSGEFLLVLPDQTLLWPRGTPKKWGRLLSVE